MVYVILITGLILIFIALKGKKIKINKEKDFDNIIGESADDFYEREILKSYVELENKVIELEGKVNDLEEKLFHKDKELKIFYENIKKEIKINENIKINFDEDAKSNPKDNKDVTDVENEDKSTQNTIKNKEIISLYSEGKSVDEIASMLRIGKGEVLLRIGLNKREM